MAGEWLNALAQAPNPGQAFLDSFQRAREKSRLDAIEAEDRAWQREQRTRQRGEWQREDQFRGATADMMLGGGVNALMMPPTGAGPANPSGMAPTGPRPFADTAVAMGQPSARERAIRANPEGFLTFEGKRLQINKGDFDNFRSLNDMGMQILGGVSDQPSYEAAKQHAAELYERFGFGDQVAAFLQGLPAEYSPEVVRQLQLQGMDTSKQLQAIARENRLSWDIEDDMTDNERADESAASLDRYRQGQLSNGRRGQDIRSRDTRRGQNLTDARGRRGQNIASRDRQRGQDITDRRVRESAAFRGRYGKVRRDEPVAVGPNGQSLVVRNGQWIDVGTGKPVQ